MKFVQENLIREGANTWHRLFLRSIKFINAILITVPFALCWYQYYADRLYHPYYAKGDMLVVLLFMILYICFGRIYSGFTISIYRISEIVYSQVLAILFTNAIIYINLVISLFCNIIIKFSFIYIPLLSFIEM